MRHGHFEGAPPQGRGPGSCGCDVSDPEDAELRGMFRDLALSLIPLLDPADAMILKLAEIEGQSPARIAARIGCSPAEAERRITQAQRCLCRLVVLAFTSEKSR